MNMDRTVAPAGAIALVVGAVVMSTAILSVTVTLAACGGNDDGATASASTTAAATASTTVATTFAIVPVFDNNGHPSSAAKSAEPADPAMRTRAGLYASPEQYRWEALMSSPYTILVDLDTSESMEAAIYSAMAVNDWNPNPPTLAWFVKSSDLRAGARLADALYGMGLDQVFLIVGAANDAR